MSSLRFSGIRFSAYPNDHPPRHVHGSSGETHVVVELGENRTVRLADRTDRISPPNAKRNVVKKVLETAAEHYDEYLCSGRVCVEKARVLTTDGEIDAAIAQASHLDQGTRVVSAVYNKPLDLLVLHLENGRRAVFPREDLQGLRDASASEIAKVEIIGGVGLHWKKLDVDLYVPSLLKGILGSQRWMVELGRKGGEARSAKKAEAARKNGARGGRPRRSASVTA